MKVAIYIDWVNEKIYTQKEFEKMVYEEEKTLIDDADEFSEWLESYYSAGDIFNFTQEQKDQALNSWCDNCREWAEDRVEGRLTKKVLEI